MSDNTPLAPTWPSTVRNVLRTLAAVALGALAGLCAQRSQNAETTWQIDPTVCIQCGRCATACVLAPSAVKCVHAFDVCGYCDLCGGYLQPYAKEFDTGAENQLCPTGAIRRRFVEEPYFEYTIDEALCVGCGRCVKGCGAFGNGSLHLQVRHDRCMSCNECAIARACPVNAYRRVPVRQPYLMKGRQGEKAP